MPDPFAAVITISAGIGTVAGFFLRHFTNGKKPSNGHESSEAAEFRGEMRQVLVTQSKTMEKVVELMGDVHQEIAHTNQVLQIIEERSRNTPGR